MLSMGPHLRVTLRQSSNAQQSGYIPPVHIHHHPPDYADTGYKLVALVDGVPTSIFDGETTYPMGQTVMQTLIMGQRSGLYIFPRVRECLQHDANVFPKHSQLLDAPRAIAKVKAWNLDRFQPPQRLGMKRAYSCVRVVELLPVPVTMHLAGWGAVPNDETHGRSRWEARHNCDTHTVPCVHSGPSHRDSCSYHRLQRTAGSLHKAQLRTVELEEDVLKLERNIAAMHLETSSAARAWGMQAS